MAVTLFRQVETDTWDFQTTAELSQLTEVLGQSRAVDAMAFGIGIQRNGYNLLRWALQLLAVEPWLMDC